MNNAQILAKVLNNPVLWVQNFVKIPDKTGKLVPFKLHDLQFEFLNEMEKYNIILKSRQLGFSTLALALCLYNACTKSNTEYLIVSYDLKSADSLFERLKIMYSTIPNAIKPSAINNNKKELKLSNNSRIICTTAGVLVIISIPYISIIRSNVFFQLPVSPSSCLRKYKAILSREGILNIISSRHAFV